MAAPNSYTEATFKGFLHAALGAVAGQLGWTVAGGDYDEVVNEALLVYNVSTIASATDIRKLRTLGRREVWRAVTRETVGDYDFSADGGKYTRSQMHDHAAAQLARMETETLQYDDLYAVQLGTLEYDYDPYQPTPLTEMMPGDEYLLETGLRYGAGARYGEGFRYGIGMIQGYNE